MDTIIDKISYKDAGVDINLGNKVVKNISPLLYQYKNFYSRFAGGIKLPEVPNPILVSSCDGVGTKIKIAIMMEKYDTIGIDLVAMSVNDVATSLAKPIFFLDYISIGKLKENVVYDIVKGIKTGCDLSNCQLLGGETAEMPDFYNEGEFDLAGFAVGVANENLIPNTNNINAGDIIIGLHSNGLHSNGFSLCRKLFFDKLKYKITDYIEEFSSSLGQELLKPTTIYSSLISELSSQTTIKGLAHITGGGIIDNVPRTLPIGIEAVIETSSLPITPIFELIKNKSNLETIEMLNIFNMGIGMAMIVSENEVSNALALIKEKGFGASIIGYTQYIKDCQPCVRLI